MNKPSNSKIFAAAWKMAREGAARFGGAAREYFAAALREAYALVRRLAERAAPVTTNTAQKVMALAAMLDITIRRNTFAWRFVDDNANRVSKYGAATKFSAKQVEIVDDLCRRYA